MRSTSPGLVAVRTPHQAERLGSSAAGASARPLARLAQDLAHQAGAARVANRAEVWVATRRALEQLGALPGPEATAERRAATVGAFDAAIGWLHRTGADPSAWSASARPRTQLVARAAALVQAALRAAERVDARSLPAIAAHGAGPPDPGGAPAAVAVVGVVPGEVDAILAIEALHAAARRAGGGARLVLPRPRPDASGDEPLADWIERRWSGSEDPPELAWIAAVAPDPSSVERIEAPTPRAEAREIAAAVGDAIAGGLAPEQVAVVVPRGDDPVVRPLLDALADAGIPASREGGDPVLDAPEVAVALDLLAMADGRLTRDGLADVLRAPGLHAGSWTGTAHEDEATRIATRVAHRLREVPVAVDRSGGARLVESLALVDPAASAVVARAVASLRAIGAARGREAVVAEWSGLVERLRLGRPSAAEIGAALRGELASSETASRTAAARLAAIAAGARGVATVVEVARALVAAEKRLGVAPGLPPGDVLAEVRELARTATSAAGGGAPRAGAVRVATARDVAGLPHALVVVAGLGATAYGASEVRGLVDEESLLELPPDRRPPPVAARRAARALELDWAIAGATRVVLTRRAGLAGGHDEAPHPVFATAAGAGDGAAAPRRAPASPLLPGARLASWRDAQMARMAMGDRVDAPPTALAAERAERERSRFFLDPKQPPGRFSGRVSPHRGVDVASRLGGDAPERPVPVTAIERAARCPFAAFASRVLRTRRVDDALEAATNRERGLLVHEALEQAFVALRAGPPSAPLAARRALAEAAALARAAPDRATPLRREAILAAVRDALAVVDLDLASGDAGAFRLAEQRFGAREPAPWGPLRLDAPPGSGEPPVWVDGQIDRLDAATDGRWVRVVDYKTGKLPPKKDEHVRSLQLALYADAARRSTSPPGADEPEGRRPPVEVTARYVEVKRGTARTRDVPVDDEALDAARSNTRRAVLRLWSGDVAPRTIDPRMCRRCDARDVCRKPAVAALDDEAETAEEPGSR